MDAGVDEVLDLIDVGLGGGVERYGVAVGHFLGKVVENGVDLGEMGVDLWTKRHPGSVLASNFLETRAVIEAKLRDSRELTALV